MSCSEFLDHLNDVLDGDGDAECKRHLELCRRCAHVLETTKKMIELYQRCEPKEEASWRKLSQ